MIGKRIVFTFLAKNDGYLNLYNGPLFRAAFLKYLHSFNPSLANTLHDSNERKPYFLTALRPQKGQLARVGRRRDYAVKVGQRFVTMLTILDNKLLSIFLQAITTNPSWQIQIGHMTFITEKIHVINEDLGKYLTLDAPAQAAFISFKSPTFFRSSEEPKNTEYFPKPVVLLKFLSNHWNAFSGKKDPKPPSDFLDWIRENVRISSFNLRTYSSHVMKKQPITGTIGWVKYVFSSDNSLGRWVCFLLKFGELAGVGAARTGGYGEIKVNFEYENNRIRTKGTNEKRDPLTITTD